MKNSLKKGKNVIDKRNKKKIIMKKCTKEIES